jgi:hypothetical protein
MNVATPTLVALALAGTPAIARASSTATNCQAQTSFRAAPGLGLIKGTRGRVSLHDGSFNCDGPVQGRQPTGPGTFSGSSHYGIERPASCATGGDGKGVMHLVLPTKQGTLRLDSPFTYTFSAVGRSGLGSGKFQGDYFSGAFTATEGNCVTSPGTAGNVTFKGTMHDHR